MPGSRRNYFAAIPHSDGLDQYGTDLAVCTGARSTVLAALQRATGQDLSQKRIKKKALGNCTPPQNYGRQYKIPDLEWTHQNRAILNLLQAKYCGQCCQNGGLLCKSTPSNKYDADHVHRSDVIMHQEPNPGKTMQAD